MASTVVLAEATNTDVDAAPVSKVRFVRTNSNYAPRPPMPMAIARPRRRQRPPPNLTLGFESWRWRTTPLLFRIKGSGCFPSMSAPTFTSTRVRRHRLLTRAVCPPRASVRSIPIPW